jgi:alpha-tubulin suppressor-like RCC1 family protein
MDWKPIETAPKDQRIWAWGDNWHWRKGQVAYAHSDYNGHKNVICRNGLAGPSFRIGDKDAPTHWMPLPEPPSKP